MEKIYDVLITYDINSKNDAVHSMVKKGMFAKGYADRYTYTKNNKVIYLPNTTIWKKSINAEQARKDLKDCVDKFNRENETNHYIERCIALEFTINWFADEGTLHSSTSAAPNKD